MSPDDDAPPAGAETGASRPTETPEDAAAPPAPDDATIALISAAHGLTEVLRPHFGANITVGESLRYLRDGLTSVPETAHYFEERLETQARLLDFIFGEMVADAFRGGKTDTAKALAALKAQKQYHAAHRLLDRIQALREKRCWDRLDANWRKD